MKLLGALALAVTLGLILVWGLTGSEHESVPIGERLSSAVSGEVEVSKVHAVLAGGSSVSENELDPEVRIEIIEPDLESVLEIGDVPIIDTAPPPRELEHPDGPWLLHHVNGEIDELGAYENDLEVGEWRWWYKNGERKAIGQFEEGVRVGSWIWWHDNGTVMVEGQYQGGEGFGQWKLYHPNGARRGEGNHVDGEISGVWNFWHEDGSVDERSTGFYKAGEKIE